MNNCIQKKVWDEHVRVGPLRANRWSGEFRCRQNMNKLGKGEWSNEIEPGTNEME